MKKTFAMTSIALATSALIACGGSSSNDGDSLDNNSGSVVNPTLQATIDNQPFLSDKITDSECKASASDDKLANNYINMACAAFEDSLIMAEQFQSAVNTFTAEPNEANLAAARAAYKKMRKPYQQAEIMRFDEAFAEGTTGIENVDAWEGDLNAWPLDESRINAIVAGTDDITTDLLSNANGDETGEDPDLVVTIGFHAIE